jgi:ABC-2 type transport system ATP-binding protein
MHLQLKHVTKTYARHIALNAFSLEAKAFEIHGILGHNGCGKSTLFKSIMGLNTLDDGQLTLNGEPITALERQRFGYMPEQRAMLMDLSAHQHAHLFGSLKGLSPTRIESQLHRYGAYLDVENLRHRRIKTLSKGQQQKTQLMLTLLHEPELVILDEPLNGLDYHSVNLFMQLLMEKRAEGLCVLISAHQMDFMDELCTHLTIMEAGRTLIQGPLRELQAHQNIRIRLNADSAWQGVSQQALWMEAHGSMVELYYDNVEAARIALRKFSSVKSIRSLSMQPVSIANFLKDAS